MAKKPVCFVFDPETNDQLNELVQTVGGNRGTTLERLIQAEYDKVVRPQVEATPHVIKLPARLRRPPPMSPVPTPETCDSFDYAFEKMQQAEHAVRGAHDSYIKATAQRVEWAKCIERLSENKTFVPAPN